MKKTTVVALRKLALRYPDAEEGVACEGTAIEKRTVKAGKKAFVFLGVSDVLLKLDESLPEATRLARKDRPNARHVVPRMLLVMAALASSCKTARDDAGAAMGSARSPAAVSTSGSIPRAPSETANAPNYQPVTEFDPRRDAASDFAEALKEAQRTHKRVLIDVGGTWCGWCTRMDRFVAGDAEISGIYAAGFVVLKVNVSPENENEAVLSRLPKIHGYPHLFVLDERGELLHSQNTSELESGASYDRAKFVEFARRWAAGAP